MSATATNPPRRTASHKPVLTGIGLICLVTLIPVISLLVLATGDAGNVWPHLVRNVLPSSLGQTIGLLAGVGLVSSVAGAGTAWLVSQYRFFGRRVLQWALILPLAIPTYIAAYCYYELLDFTGPVQEMVRAVGGFATPAEYWFPDVRSLGGAIFVMSAVLYPYVYLTSRILFEMQASSMLEVSRVLGAGPARLFFKIALPLARPAIAAGAALAMMEALNDIGAVEILGVRTLTFSVFNTWLNRGSLAGAAQIACLMLVIVAALLILERSARRARSYSSKHGGAAPPALKPLTGTKSAAAFIVCALPVLAGFGAPAALLFSFALRRLEDLGNPGLLDALANSLLVSGMTAAVTMICAVAFVLTAARQATPLTRVLVRLATLGYAVPGSVLAIGTLFAFSAFDNSLDAFLRANFGISSGLLLTGSAAIVIYACSVRFLAISYGAIDAGHARLNPNFVPLARTLGRTGLQAITAVELPLLRRAIAAGGLLVFVDTMKELPATILLRPFNFPTLATFVYERASRALFEDAAIAALAIVAVGLVPIFLLGRMQSGIAQTAVVNGTKKTSGPRPA